MKKRFALRALWLSALAVILFAALGRADNPCVETGPHLLGPYCHNSGSLANGWVVAPTNIITVVGRPVASPIVSGLAITNATEGTYYVYDCTPSMNYFVATPITNTFGSLYFSPTFPGIYWVPGTYSYSSLVDAWAIPCGTNTYNLGTVTVRVGTNNADVLIDVDFGAASAGGKTGYAAIGDGGFDYWNYLNSTGRITASLTNLVTAEGWVSPVGLLVTNLAYGGTNGSSDPMYNDYLYTNSASANLAITNLPSGIWNIYLYASDGNFTLSSAGVSYGSQTCYDTPVSTPLVWQQGLQYVVFNNVGVTNGQPVFITASPGINGRALISGLQIASQSHTATTTITNLAQDSDYDGISDINELADRTNPNDPNSCWHVRLAYFPFDDTNGWTGSSGQIPLAASNLVGIQNWSTNAVQIDTNANAVLKYRDVETNGNANINLRSGSISFWFKPHWSSVDQGGSGPQDEGRFIEMGTQGTTNGWWGLVIGSGGTNIYFGTQTNLTATLTTNLSIPVSLTSNVWHQIVLTYAPTNSSLWWDGQPVITNATGVAYFPALAVRQKGFTIGSSAAGTNQVHGAIDELQTFNYPLSTSEITNDYQSKMQILDVNGISVIWELDNLGTLGVDPNANPAGDGISNLEKSQNGMNPNQFYPARLGYWRFNNPPFWSDESGLAPSMVQGLYPVPSWSGDAVKINSAVNSWLGYPGVRTNGSAVTICPAGTGSIRFWYKPDWEGSADGPGQGPGNQIRLFEIGRQSDDATYGWFVLTVNPAGTALTFSTEANGVHTDNSIENVSFATNTWYQIVLTYTPTNSLFYVNGQGWTNGCGVTNLPTQNVLKQGFYLVYCNSYVFTTRLAGVMLLACGHLPISFQ